MGQIFTRNEARTHVLNYLTGGWFGEMIQAELNANGGDPACAVKNVSDWACERLGNHGCCNDAFRCEVYGTMKTTQGASVWYGDCLERWKGAPDELITWKQIFAYVAGEPQQMSLL